MGKIKYESITDGTHKAVTTDICVDQEGGKVKAIQWCFEMLDGPDAGTVTYRRFANSSGGKWHLINTCKLFGVAIQEQKEILKHVTSLKGKVFRVSTKTPPPKDGQPPRQDHQFFELDKEDEKPKEPELLGKEIREEDLEW